MRGCHFIFRYHYHICQQMLTSLIQRNKRKKFTWSSWMTWVSSKRITLQRIDLRLFFLPFDPKHSMMTSDTKDIQDNNGQMMSGYCFYSRDSFCYSIISWKGSLLCLERGMCLILWRQALNWRQQTLTVLLPIDCTCKQTSSITRNKFWVTRRSEWLLWATGIHPGKRRRREENQRGVRNERPVSDKNKKPDGETKPGEDLKKASSFTQS